MYGEHEDLLERYKAAHKSGFKVNILELMDLQYVLNTNWVIACVTDIILWYIITKLTTSA